jgi:large subunit ribosomal protein L32e
MMENMETEEDEKEVEGEDIIEAVEIKASLDPELRRLMRAKIRQKSKKPKFRRYEAHKKLRLRNKSWRRPRGMDNKLRKRIAGKKPVCVGFGSPARVRNLHPSGFREVLVSNPAQLDAVNPEKEAIRVSSSVGLRKRLLIEDRAKERGIRVLNPLKVG